MEKINSLKIFDLSEFSKTNIILLKKDSFKLISKTKSIDDNLV
jgi:hypothetical protein